MPDPLVHPRAFETHPQATAPTQATRRVLLVLSALFALVRDVRIRIPVGGGQGVYAAPGASGHRRLARSHWRVRFVDENLRPASSRDFAWAEVVFVSGMHIQRGQINDINRRAHDAGATTVLGGPSVSASPEYYPDFDYLHLGELGDATEALFARLEADPRRPASQMVLSTALRRDLTDFPQPAYELADLRRYFMGSIQFSSGCPFDCEFCDIPALYGRVPRMKTPAQVCAELDKLRARGFSGAIYFVDDNLIANRRALRDLLPPRSSPWHEDQRLSLSVSPVRRR